MTRAVSALGTRRGGVVARDHFAVLLPIAVRPAVEDINGDCFEGRETFHQPGQIAIIEQDAVVDWPPGSQGRQGRSRGLHG